MATEFDEQYFERAVGRIFRLILFLGIVGTAGEWIAHGWTWAAGFSLGAVASFLNFKWLKKLVDALADSVSNPGTRRGGGRVAVLLGLRYLILAIAAYAILRYSPLSLPAALTGLFTAVAAVIVEILFELVYARN